MEDIATDINSNYDSKENYRKVTSQYFDLIERHLDELIAGDADDMLELNDIAKLLFVSPKQLIKIITSTKGNHPCHFYVERIIEKSKEQLKNTELSVAEIAIRLTYDPSNFTKFFKKHTGQIPTQYRNEIKVKSSP
ncbi:MAG: AraC family transcriptional regulator [Pseudopedobacter saltans]|uniref:AraC family transcriptional regulator n=1 Tax=Pseudopedobacter saltans TaxID=151895 RepID=A0A2W5F7I7_9SPHI|nr:MAG: AraC family transcriptional regulator [Pseudopedobacter saltans]